MASTRLGAVPPTAIADPLTYGDGLLEGSWDSALTADDLVVLADDLERESGLAPLTAIRLRFSGPNWWQGFVFGDELWRVGGIPEGDRGAFTIDGGTLTTDNGSAVVTYLWRRTGDELSLEVEDCTDRGRPCADLDMIETITERAFTRSDPDPAR